MPGDTQGIWDDVLTMLRSDERLAKDAAATARRELAAGARCAYDAGMSLANIGRVLGITRTSARRLVDTGQDLERAKQQ